MGNDTPDWLDMIVDTLVDYDNRAIVHAEMNENFQTETQSGQMAQATEVEAAGICGHSPDPLHFMRYYRHGHLHGGHKALAADEKPRINASVMDLEDLEVYADAIVRTYADHDPNMSLEEFKAMIILNHSEY